MDSWNKFCALETPLASFPLLNAFFVAFPNFLAIGFPTITNSTISFKENSYIKIPICFYADFYQSLLNIQPIILKEKTSTDCTKTIIDFISYQLVWQIENEIVSLKIIKHSLNKISIVFDEFQYLYLFNGFKDLFFRPFCLQYFVTFSFYLICENLTVQDIEKIASITDATQLIKNLPLNYSEEIIFLISEQILSFKSELTLYKKLLSEVPPRNL